MRITVSQWKIICKSSHFNFFKIRECPKLELNWSEMTLSYQMMVERYPNLKEEVGGSNPGCEISSLLDGKLARW